MVIGEKLKALRERKKLSQGDIEKRTGLLRVYISRVENGHTTPAVETLEKFARALEVPMYQLFYDGEKPPVPIVPTPRLNVPGRAVAFLMCGLHFQVFLGASCTPDVRELCCVSSSRKPIFSRDIRDNSVHSYAVLMATAKTVGALGDAEDLNPSSR
jgi:DNA-binding XRE family transcriptional regulator